VRSPAARPRSQPPMPSSTSAGRGVACR
jgi:hypothetical protein